MTEVPMTGAIAEYRGKRYRILFGGDNWVALLVGPNDDLPDAFARGESRAGRGRGDPWAKVPKANLDGVIQVRVSGKLSGHTVSLQQQLPDGRVGVEFIGSPAIARNIGLVGDQYMGWTGIVAVDELEDIHVEEIRRA